ncbi:MAG TPA: hypothetical protein VMQ93_05875 [Novosphingobium sp.]|nr:hypothetical protein [Novosphingobium sp.]
MPPRPPFPGPIALLAAALAPGCAAEPVSPAPTCAAEASLLVQPTTVRAQPRASAAAAANLPAGTPVYTCDADGPWSRIMYPPPGTPADCSQRPAASRCPTGWIEGEPAAQTAG